MLWRNPAFNARGTIDCEIDHPDFGWIPFTVDPADTGATFDVAELYDAIVAAGDIAPYVPPAPTGDLVNTERDRRIEQGFTFGGVAYDFNTEAQGNITAMGAQAGFAMAEAAEGDLRWYDPAHDFVWIAADNTPVPMDAQTCFAFTKAASKHKSAHIFAAIAIKGMTPIPANFTDNAYWP